ncbi:MULTISPECIES: TerB family tellurite resistance protein [unclassified Pseudoalteromonas]|jgi:uncharacterized tellurite resistance protein B-like protein|uniref:TerB family tellurite resistance protein n=1 Tax=unclassified Pseudoalteromonas TaxID=194690 RepID=UPI0015FF9933|nr:MULTISPECIES: TerB family tellurite resistance protein [unclassified Pseudoalteromonas]MBB1351239.1 TerB family tellurite resistance protein [Pseudoalteromonas sp. SG45-3]MBB1358659.1 TerB family tellurite resistance protein [Pseudoalteromonas sp. SG45-6]
MTELDMYLDFLIAIMKADSIIEPEELDFLLECGRSLNLSAADLTALKDRAINTKIDINSLCLSIKKTSNPTFTMNLIKDAYSIAKSDGSIDEEELSIIKQLVKTLGVYDDNTFEEVIDWCEEALYIKSEGSNLYLKIKDEL